MMEKLCVLCEHFHIEESDEDYYCPTMPWLECKEGKFEGVSNPTDEDVRRIQDCETFKLAESVTKLVRWGI